MSGGLTKLLGMVAVFCAVGASAPGARMLGLLEPFELWTWGYAAPWVIVGAIAATLAKLSHASDVSEYQRAADLKAADEESEFVLFLRPFAADQTVQLSNPNKGTFILFPSTHSEPGNVPFERILARAFEPERQLRAIGGNASGPGTIRPDEPAWRESFASAAKAAAGIVVVVLPGTEILWECEYLRSNRLLRKTVFVLPPEQDVPAELVQRSDAFMHSLRSHNIHLPKLDTNLQVVRLDESGKASMAMTVPKVSESTFRRALDAILTA